MPRTLLQPRSNATTIDDPVSDSTADSSTGAGVRGDTGTLPDEYRMLLFVARMLPPRNDTTPPAEPQFTIAGDTASTIITNVEFVDHMHVDGCTRIQTHQHRRTKFTCPVVVINAMHVTFDKPPTHLTRSLAHPRTHTYTLLIHTLARVSACCRSRACTLEPVAPSN